VATVTQVPANGYSALNTTFDSVRPAGMICRVRCVSRSDSINGTYCGLNYTPLSDWDTHPAKTYFDLPGHTAEVVKGDIMMVPWMPLSGDLANLPDQNPYAFIKTDVTASAYGTCIVIDCLCDLSDLMTFEFEVFAIWEGTLESHDSTFLQTASRSWPMDIKHYTLSRDALLIASPLYSQERIMHRDDGTLKAITAAAKEGIGAFHDVKSMTKGSLHDRVKAVVSLAGRVGRFASSIGSLFSAADYVRRALPSMSVERRAELRRVLIEEFGRDGLPLSQPEASMQDITFKLANGHWPDEECVDA